MIEIALNKEINGNQLAEELGVDVWDLLDTGSGVLQIKKNIAKKKAEEVLANHTPQKPEPPTIQEKLFRAGINLDELRLALGL